MYNVRVYNRYEDYVDRSCQYEVIKGVQGCDITRFDDGGFLIISGEGERYYFQKGVFILAEPIKEEEES